MQQGSTHEVLPTALTYLSSLDPVCKKLSYWLLLSHLTSGDSSDGFLLAANTFSKDCTLASPAARAMAIRALSWGSAWAPDLCARAAERGLKDAHAHVRRSAVIAQSRLFHARAVPKEHSAELLYNQIRDPDPLVQCLSLQVLENILAAEGGVVVSKNMAVHLLRTIEDVPEWTKGRHIALLSKYKPGASQEIRYEMMNILDPMLQSPSASVCIQTLNYFLTIAPELKSEILVRAKTPLLQFVAIDCPEIAACVLDTIAELYLESDLLRAHYQTFLCKQVDPLYVKRRKLHILGFITDASIIDTVLTELTDLTTSSASLSMVVLKTCVAIGRREDLREKVVRTLLTFLTLKRPILTGEVLCALEKLRLPDDLSGEQVDLLLSSIQFVLNKTEVVMLRSETAFNRSVESSDTELNETHARAALWLLGEWSMFSDGIYLLKDFVENFCQWTNTGLTNALLLTSLKMFLRNPAQGQSLLALVLEQCSKQGNVQTQDKAKYYYCMLKKSVEKTRQIVLNDTVSAESEK